MLIGYGQPTAGLSWSLTHTATFLTSTDALTDGKPARATRLHWRTDSIPSVTHNIGVRATWTTPTRVRIVALLGVSLPVGTKLELYGRRAIDAGYTYGLGGNSLSQPVVELPDGSRCAWWVLPAGNDPLTGLELRVYNRLLEGDLFTPLFDADSTFDLGEIAILQGAELDMETSWSYRLVDPSVHSRSLGAQLSTVARRTYREADLQLVPAPVADVRQRGLANGDDLEVIQAKLSGAGRGALIPRFGTDDALSLVELNRTALYGHLMPGAITHAAGDNYGARWLFEEIPGP